MRRMEGIRTYVRIARVMEVNGFDMSMLAIHTYVRIASSSSALK